MWSDKSNNFLFIAMTQNDGDVKIVVGNNFDEIVLDESKDVLLEVSFISSWMDPYKLCSLILCLLPDILSC